MRSRPPKSARLTAKERVLKLTPRQADYLLLAMQDYIDVTADAQVLRWAKQIRAKLLSEARLSAARRGK